MSEQEIREGIQEKCALEKELPYDSERVRNLKRGEYMLREISKNYDTCETELKYTTWFGEFSRRWFGSRSASSVFDEYKILPKHQEHEPSITDPVTVCYWSEEETEGEPRIMFVRSINFYLPGRKYRELLEYLVKHPGEKVIVEYFFGTSGEPWTHVEFSYLKDSGVVKCSKYDYSVNKITVSKDLTVDMVKYGMFDFLEDW